MRKLSNSLLPIALIAVGLNIALDIHANEDKASVASVPRAGLTQLSKDVDVQKLDVVKSFEEAKKLENEILEMYREIRAAELSKIQRQTLERSLSNTLAPRTEREGVDLERLRAKAKDAKAVQAYQDELGKVMQQSDNMVSKSRELLESLLPEMVQEEMEQEMEEMTAEEIAEMASQDQSEQSEQSDQSEQQEMTEEMKQQLAEMQAEAQKKMEESEKSLEDALKELEQAEKILEEKKEELAEAKKEDEKAEEANEEAEEQTAEEKAAEEAAEEKKAEELATLEAVIEEAEEAVTEAIEAVKESSEAAEEKIAKAEEAMEKVKEALAETQEAQTEMAEAEANDTKAEEAHTEKAVEKMEAAQAAMAEAAQMMQAMQAMSQAFGQGTGENKVATMQAMAQLAQAASGQFLDVSKQMKGQGLNVKPLPVPKGERPPTIDRNGNYVSGRKVVSSGGLGAQWFFVGDWHLIGPYDNAGRKNITKVYPPQSKVDLSDRYVGKQNMPIEWNYDSFSHPMVWPGFTDQYTIYYGYTELEFEKPMDLWIAIGSDDRSDLWINGMPVWYSSNRLKGWNPNEGFRKVHFKKGRNKVLFRLENGWHGAGFSMFIFMGQPGKQG